MCGKVIWRVTSVLSDKKLMPRFLEGAILKLIQGANQIMVNTLVVKLLAASYKSDAMHSFG